jgi:hypothetical protein
MSFVGEPMGMIARIRCRYGTAELPARAVEARIAAFLEGKTDGAELLHALYDHVLREPIPGAMSALLKSSRAAG